jgi:hypothetical protein
MCVEQWERYLAASERVRECERRLNGTPGPVASYSRRGDEALPMPKLAEQRKQALDVLDAALWDQIKAFGAYLAAGGHQDHGPSTA